MENYEIFAEMGTKTLEDEKLKDFLRERADESEGFENMIFEYGLDCIANNRVRINCLNNLSNLVEYLKDEWATFIDICGEEDEICTLPALKRFGEAAGLLLVLEAEWGFRSKKSLEDDDHAIDNQRNIETS